MRSKVQAYWDKSVENLCICAQSTVREKFNVAASRYYYALRFAVVAYFTCFNEQPSDGGEWENRSEFHERAGIVIKYDEDVERILYKAWQLRCQGDYEHEPVERSQILKLREQAEKIFCGIKKEIMGDFNAKKN